MVQYESHLWNLFLYAAVDADFAGPAVRGLSCAPPIPAGFHFNEVECAPTKELFPTTKILHSTGLDSR